MTRFIIVFIISLFAASCANRIDMPKPPLGTAGYDTAPPAPISDMVIPIRVEKAAIEDRFAGLLPEEFSGRVGLEIERNTVLEWHVVRERPRFTGMGRVMRVEIPLTVGVAVRRDVLGKSYRAGCEGDRRLKTTLTFDVPLSWTDDWTLTATPEIRPMQMAGCEVPVVGYLLQGEAVSRALDTFVRRTVGELKPITVVDLGASMQTLWTAMNRPVPLEGVGVMTLSPLALFVSPMEDDGSAITSAMGMTFRPEITVGGSVESVTEPAPLPPLAYDRREPGVHLSMMVRLPFERASAVLTEKLKGTPVAPGATVENVTVEAVPGRVRIGLRVAGAFRGTLYVVGTPVVADDEIRFENVESGWRPEDLPGFLLGVLMDRDLVNRVAEAARFPASADAKTLSAVFGLKMPEGAGLAEEVSISVDDARLSNMLVLESGFASVLRVDAKLDR